ncbi:hypothetical protein ACFPM0_36590 [Pseudonocardia sulfidoxydans]|uniref:hypothetical protein n=1 Tax=Pseudonocardia sulfidoxydans TaxID=54011 RepID=UPI00360DF609
MLEHRGTPACSIEGSPSRRGFPQQSAAARNGRRWRDHRQVYNPILWKLPQRGSSLSRS